MRLNGKGQVTIPVALREQLGLHPGDELTFELDGDAIRITKGVQRRGHDLVARLRGSGDVAMTTDEIMALTRAD
ncbi:MAG TPA: AbrB/MazE/SpoVT family DNA-binding domain-containing protein [Actinokineospora sp.]|jgi:AbrB family looped-hinge helix DNA binding protein|nr:AbrB/MazE/SpoVT family DNA-binding domain-containing protein [Actinokineospora sp.]